MLTGQADIQAIEKVKALADLHVCLSKPWDSQDLIEQIQTGLAKL
jgi:FixJ family two-component response regulator